LLFWRDYQSENTIISHRKIANQFWLEIPQHSKYTHLDQYIMMPNHLHGIIVIDNPNNPCTDIKPRRNVQLVVPTSNNDDNLPAIMSELSPQSNSLSVIIRSYKSAVTRWCRQNGYDHFAWQSRFYEHIIRHDGSLDIIREYILNNPVKWLEDPDYMM
jgi:putative transposase